MSKNFSAYFAATKYLDSLVNLSITGDSKKNRLELKRFAYFLHLLNDPQRGLKYIHIGGTSGKGSVANMICNILTEAGYITGLYTSPHPTTPIEKIKVNDLLIAPEDFAKLLNQIKPAIDQAYIKSPYGRPTWFEINTAIALLYFKKLHCNYVILEVGLGGKTDATNIIPPAKITIINQVHFDHLKKLGNTLTAIAKQKAGIIKTKTQFFTPNTNHSTVLKIFRQRCRQVDTNFNLIKPPKKPYKLKLLGEHQQLNAELAASACRQLGVAESKIRAGLKKTAISCRLEIIQQKPLVILDGGHNQSKIKSVATLIKNLTYQKLYLIIALTLERNGAQVFKYLLPLADQLVITRYQASVRKCYPPLLLAKRLNFSGPQAIFLDSNQALANTLRQAGSKDLILITGSFYLAGELRKHWRPELKILTQRKA